MTKNNLAFVSDAIYPYNTGGKEKRLYDITQILSQNGFKVDIYTMKWWPEPTQSISQGLVNIHSLCSHSVLYSNGRRSIRETIKFSLAVFKLLIYKFDYLEADHMPYLPVFTLSLVALIKQKKFSISWFEVWDKNYWQQYFGIFGFLGFAIEYLICHLPFTIISISNFTTSRLDQILHRTKNIITLPIGIDLKSISKSPRSNSKFDLIYSGRLNKHKQINLLIQSVKLLVIKHPQLKCLIVGSGPEKIHLQTLVTKLKLEKNITFSNFFSSSQQLYSQFKSCQLFVLPSIREGYSITTLEAQACGLPVITILHPQNASTSVTHPILEKFQSQNSALSLSKNIDRLLSSPSNKSQLIKFTEKFSWPNLLPIYLKFYSGDL